MGSFTRIKYTFLMAKLIGCAKDFWRLLMQIGDLVELSAKGQKIWHLGKAHKKTGIITKLRNTGMYPIIVFWFGVGQIPHRRPTLKFLSKTQKK